MKSITPISLPPGAAAAAAAGCNSRNFKPSLLLTFAMLDAALATAASLGSFTEAE